MILHTPNSKPARMATVLETTILLYSKILWVRNSGTGSVCNCSTESLPRRLEGLRDRIFWNAFSITCPVPGQTWFKDWTKPRSLARSPVHGRSTEMGLLRSHISYITAQYSKTLCSHEQSKSSMAFWDQALELALQRFCHTLLIKAT